jgi:Trypsin/PEP-CTERM motif
MTFRPAARAAGAALMLAPALLSAQMTSTKVVDLGGQQMTVTAQSLVSAAGNIVTDPHYQTPVSPAYNGVGSIHIQTTQGLFICTGSLLADGKTVLTAGHCVSHFGTATVTSISVDFYPVNSTAVNLVASSWNANPAYTGQVIDENDVGVIHLAAEAPANISRYALATTSGVNSNFEFVGFGQKGSFGAGVSFNAGFSLANRRQGANLFDTQLGDPRWDGFWDDPAAPSAHVLLADFDDGSTGFNSHDGMCWIGQFSGSDSMGTTECNAGLGIDEAISGPGDSGGPGFVFGKIASVTSFGLSFGQFGPGPFPDNDTALDSSFGEFGGFTDVAFQAAWIATQMDLTSLDPTVLGPLAPGQTVVATPEPSTTVLLASGLIGVAGFARRRRKA